MKQIFIILLVFLTKVSFGQVSASYYDIPELKPVNVLKALELAGTFRCDVGIFEVTNLKLDSFSKFDNYLHSCDGRESLATGNWSLAGPQIVLSGTTSTLIFDILQFDEYYILVPHEYKEQFIKEMKSILKKVKRSTIKEYDFPLYVLGNLNVIVYFKKCSA
jgi:hypothetical protein